MLANCCGGDGRLTLSTTEGGTADLRQVGDLGGHRLGVGYGGGGGGLGEDGNHGEAVGLGMGEVAERGRGLYTSQAAGGRQGELGACAPDRPHASPVSPSCRVCVTVHQ
jgi:hypothetical protein